jgi:hypothetical protein
MAMLQIAQHVPGETTQLFKLRTGRSGGQFSGVMLPLIDPSSGGPLQLRVAVDNPAFFQSLADKTTTGGTTFRVRDNDGKTLSVTSSRNMDSLVFEVAGGQTLVVTPDTDDVETHASLGPAAVAAVFAVAGVAAVAIMVTGAVAVVAMGGAFEGDATSGEEGSSVDVKASSGGRGEGG